MTKPIARLKRVLNAMITTAIHIVFLGLTMLCAEQGHAAGSAGLAMLWAGLTLIPLAFTAVLLPVTVGVWVEVFWGEG